jgi:uncharacterized protein (TIGR03083 family)
MSELEFELPRGSTVTEEPTITWPWLGAAHRLLGVTSEMILEAFGAESECLSEVLAGIDDAAFARASGCPPWSVAELAFHVRMTIGRLPGMIDGPEPTGDGLVSAAGYYRADQRFSDATNADRIESAQRGAAALPNAAARARDFAAARSHAWALLGATPPERVVRTRHGDRMLLPEFLRTRVFELAVHGLDLAAALDRGPWMTDLAAEVTGELLLPAAAGARLRTDAGWDQVTLIATLTGRRPATSAESRLIESLGGQRLALG